MVTEARSRPARRASQRHPQDPYQVLVQSVHEYALVVLALDGEILSWNPGAERMTGRTAQEVLGTNFAASFSESDIKRERPQEILGLAAEAGTYDEEGVRLRKDGSLYTIRTTFTALRNGAGTLTGYSVVSSEVDDNAQSEGRYRGLLEAAPDAMVVVNPAGEIVLLNVQAEKQFGYRRDELVGQPVTNIIPEGFAERLIADELRTTEEALAQVIGTGIELVALRKDKTEFPIELMLSPLQSAEGILVTAAIRDISVRKAAEETLLDTINELARSNEELGQFAYIASHDLQEPLRMVASYTQLLSRRYKGKLDSDADEFIAYAVDGANRMQRLIQDLLAYSRVGTAGSVLQPVESAEALEQALRNLTRSIEDSHAVVTHDELPVVMADEMQLTQLFQNLVGNAIKYQGTGTPVVHVGSARKGKKWNFSVKDNGLGIAPEYFDRIFGMFQRLHKREEFDGTGIGLAICKKIVERHGGTISVESVPGQGSTFRFALVATERHQ